MKNIKFIYSLLLPLAFSSMVGISVREPIKEARAEVTYEDISISTISLKYETGAWFMWFTSSDADWPSDYNTYRNLDCNKMSELNIGTHIFFNSNSLNDGKHYNGDEKINKYVRPNYFSISVKAIPSTFGTMTLKQGLILPSLDSYLYSQDPTKGSPKFYRIANDVVYDVRKVNSNEYTFVERFQYTTIHNELDSLSVITNGANKYLSFKLASSDYGTNKDYSCLGSNIAYQRCSSFARVLQYNGDAQYLENCNIYLNIGDTTNTVNILATNFINSLTSQSHLIVPSGTVFPSLGCLKGENNIAYELEDAITFTYYNNNFHICDFTGAYKTSGNKHWHVCSICGIETTRESHITTSGEVTPTCTEYGYDECTYCEVCGYVLSHGEAINPLGHDYINGEIEYSEEGHWHKCARECGSTTELEAHHYGDDGRTCTVCQYVKPIAFINVVGGYFANSSSETEYRLNSDCTVIANTPEEGKMFSCWKDENNETVSTNSTYTFTVTKDITLTSYYIDDTNDNGPDLLNGEDPSQNDDGNKENKGCGGSIVASSTVFVITTLIGFGILSFKKKEN